MAHPGEGGTDTERETGTFINFRHKFLQLKFAVCLSVSTGMKIKRHEHEVNKTFGAT